MVEYRRGVKSQRKNDLWHWHADCQSYPFGTFTVRTKKPSDDELCMKCAGLSGQG